MVISQSLASFRSQAAKIQLVLLDVDGVLTDGCMYYTPQGEVSVGFHIQDGLGLRLLLKHGIEVGILTGKNHPAVTHRMQELGVKHLYQGLSDKLPTYESIIKTLKIPEEQVAYMGDDLPDLPILKRVGFSVCPADANPVIRKAVHTVTQAKGGRGAVRELIDLILVAKSL